jgi:hypothetical protein
MYLIIYKTDKKRSLPCPLIYRMQEKAANARIKCVSNTYVSFRGFNTQVKYLFTAPFQTALDPLWFADRESEFDSRKIYTSTIMRCELTLYAFARTTREYTMYSINS